MSLSRREIRYGRQLRSLQPSQIGHHQVTYDVVATPIRPTNTRAREIRHGARVALAAVPNWASSGHLRRCSDADTTNKYSSRVKEASLLSWPTIKGH
eukprot:scaffold11236_cov211-Skeletonema_marinoi.AAC.4